MYSTVVTTALAALVGQAPGLPTPYPPDESDLLRGADQHPMIELLLDTSCSMGSSPLYTPCAWFATTVDNRGPFNSLDKNLMMEAALVGCRSADDGVLDRWDTRASFAIRYFGDGSSGNTSLQATFNASHADLESAVLGAGAYNNTPMSAGLGEAAADFNRILTDGPTGGGRVNTLQCRRNFVLLLSDGEPNDRDGTGASACNGATVNIPSNEPWVGSRYMMNNGDMLCSVADEQQIGTYTIGFGRPGDFNPTYLQRIATEGAGRYYYASNVDSLNRAFEQIILSIAERAAVYGSGGTVQRQGLFSGDTNYLASYRTVDGGSWVGNLKRVCVTPPVRGRARDGSTIYDTTVTSCMLQAIADPAPGFPDRQRLVPNPTPRDTYTNTTNVNSDVGGTGALLRSRLSDGIGRDRASSPRAMYTYFPEAATPRYVSLDIPTLRARTITDENLWMSSGDTWKIVNRLNGFSYNNSPADGRPTELARWPVGDAVHATPVLIKYTADCNAANQCFVVLPTNNGIVHIFDAFSGRESSALVPGELWQPSDLVHHQLADLERQPTFETNRRYYIDGPAQLFHRDSNGDGVVNGTDTAYLVFGLGRGGRVYYAMDFTRFTPGAAPPDVRPIAGYAGTAFSELRDTWSNPWLGRVQFGASQRNVAIFASGHHIEFDRPDARVPGLANGGTDRNTVRTDCNRVAIANGLPPALSCELTLPFSPGLDIPLGPFSMPNAIAYRVHFGRFSMSGSDRVYVTDGVERWANVVGGVGGTTTSEEPLSPPLSGGWSNWVYGPQFFVRMVSEMGRPVDVVIDDIEYMTADPLPDVQHYPTIYAVALDGTNGWLTSGRAFDGNRAENVKLVSLTRDCRGAPNCVDASTNPRNTAALDQMTCPVSSEVSVVNFSNELRLYWGDECGQIFVAVNPDPTRARTNWRVRRLAHLSWNRGGTPDMSDQRRAIGRSRDVRKIYRRLDVVASTCPGRRVYGVYFGTGDEQRPLARADGGVPSDQQYLRSGSTARNGRDLMGVIYDDDDVADITERDPDFHNATADVTIPVGAAQNGWYIELAPSEKMLRDPLVFQNVAYFKTFEPGAAATECEAGSGIDRVYAMNSCNAEPVLDSNGNGRQDASDRVTSEGSEDIGPDPYVITPRDAPPIVVASGPMAGGAGNRGVFQRAASPRPRIYNWRLPR